MNYRIVYECFLIIASMVFFNICSCSKNSTGDVVEDDGIAPAIVTDLAVSTFTDNSVTLTWTASGDDSTAGTACEYDLRVSAETIHWGNFDSAFRVPDIPAPKPSGQNEQFTLSGLTTDSTYHFALIVLDEEGNYDGVSNCVSATCFNDFVVDIPDVELLAAIRLQLNKPTGDILKSDLYGMDDLLAEDGAIANLTGLEYCANLVILSLINNSVSDLTPLTNLDKLVQLNLGNNEITDITPLACLTDLTMLYLKMNDIADLTPLAGLTALTFMDLQENQVVDVSPLSGLSGLTSVNLSYNCIRDINPLVNNMGFGAGDHVVLNQNPLDHESIMTHIAALRARGVDVFWVDNLTPPAIVDDLEAHAADDSSVVLSWTSTGEDCDVGFAYRYEIRYSTMRSDLENWSGGQTVTAPPDPDTAGTVQTATVSGLEKDTAYYFALRVQDNSENWSGTSNIVMARPYTDETVTFSDAALEVVIRNALLKPSGDIYRSDLGELEVLTANSSGVSNLTGLEYCVNLRQLYLADNSISDVGPLAELLNLYELNIQGNDITDIAPLGALVNLIILQLGNNTVGDIGALTTLTNLWLLSMDFAGLSSIQPLENMTSLEYLFFSGNSVTDISSLSACTSLKYLYADYNAIVDITVLSNLSALNMVSLKYNDIEDVSPLVANEDFADGDQVMLENNPLSTESITVHIPALRARAVTVSY
ncbi:MAG: leucine-rich repeat domain-containing protein [Candidatus Zixiibacteriota bacterium]